MARIDDKKAYDIVLQSWIIKCLKKKYTISLNVINFIMKAKENSKVISAAGGQTLGNV